MSFLRTKKLSISLLVLFVAAALFLVGCGNEEAGSTNADSDENAAREVTHAMGTTKVEGTPKRIVTLYQGANDAIVAFGITPVGAVNAWLPEDPKIYDYLKDDLEGVTLVGDETQPNLEEIAKLKPDLIIASKLRHEEVYEQLTEIAPTIAHETVFMYKDTVKLMGEALNQEEKANEILTNWDNRVADLSAKLEEKLGDEWPLEVSILNFRPDHARIYNTGFAGSVLEEVGFARPENQQIDDAVTMLEDKEAITDMNADVFYIFNEDDPAVAKTFEEWTNHPLWKDLDAVKADQVYMVDVVTWNMAGGILAANLMLDDIYDRFEIEE